VVMDALSMSQFFTWTPEESTWKARQQTAASNCGATALVNVFVALGVHVPDREKIDRAVHTRSRKRSVSTTEYLAARSVAGCTGEDIVNGCREVAGQYVESRFFACFPKREVDLQSWLAGWLSLGCSAVATINLQAIGNADAWHHQMIFGVDEAGVHMANGSALMSIEEIRLGLESPSVLRIRQSDALSCSPFDAENCDALGDRWVQLHVRQQLLHMKNGRSQVEHIVIPAAYRAGITIFAKKGTPAAALLQSTDDLPLQCLHHEQVTSESAQGPVSPLKGLELPGKLTKRICLAAREEFRPTPSTLAQNPIRHSKRTQLCPNFEVGHVVRAC